MKWTILIASLLLTVTTGEGRELSLKEAIRLADQHSFELKKARAETEAAEKSLDAATAQRFPTLSAQGAAFYIDDVPTLDISLPGSETITREIGSKENYQIDLRASLPIYTGGRIGSGIDIARASRDITGALEKADLDRVHLQARTEYLNFLKTTRLLESAKASLRRSQLIRQNVQSLYDAGAADSVDLFEAGLAVTQAEFAVDRARSNARSAEIRLVILLGLSPTEALTPTTQLENPPAVDTSLTLREDKPELLAAQARVNVNRSQISLTQSDYLPTLSVYGGYSYGKPNLDRFNNTWNDYFTVGATLSWSLNVFSSPARSSSARYALEASQHHRDRVQEQLNREALLALEDLKLAHRRFVSARREHQITADNYRLATAKHRAGGLSSNRLLEIETTLTAAESHLAAARTDYYIAESRYLYAIGSDRLEEGL